MAHQLWGMHPHPPRIETIVRRPLPFAVSVVRGPRIFKILRLPLGPRTLSLEKSQRRPSCDRTVFFHVANHSSRSVGGADKTGVARSTRSVPILLAIGDVVWQ